MSMASTASDLRRPSGGASTPGDHLFVVMSCATPLQPPSRHALAAIDEVHIGRGSERTAVRRDERGSRRLLLTLNDAHVSTAHARLVVRDGTWNVEDLASKNGTCVNGSLARAARLTDGDCVQVGQTLLVVRTAMPTPAHTVADLTANGRVPALATLVPALARELDELATVAVSAVPLVLLSETGTGKDLLARAVHAISRRPGAFVPVNCGGLPQTLMESVLFGHKRGAFSGAIADHPGLFRAASGGTLLLDEVGDMSPTVQAAVLRALQDGEVLPVGDTHATHVDARIVAATHRDLEALVAAGRFREDLLARLSGFTFRLPPLRERREDIGLLAGALLRRSAAEPDREWSFSADAGLALLRHSWPQNVRELEKCLLRAGAIAGTGRIEVEHLSDAVRGEGRSHALPSSDDELRAHLTALLDANRGNISVVAAAMRTSRSQVHRWLKRLAVDAVEFRR